MRIVANVDTEEGTEAKSGEKGDTFHIDEFAGPKIVDAPKECIVNQKCHTCGSEKHDMPMREMPRHNHPLLIIRLSPSFVLLGVSPPEEAPHQAESFLLARRLSTQLLSDINRVLRGELLHCLYFHY